MATHNQDIENGGGLNEKDARVDDNQDMGEYGNLVRYISTYRDGRRGSTASGAGEDAKPKKKGLFSRKPKSGSEGQGFETPDDWLNTDMKQGLSEADVTARRSKTGFNELSSEKENLFLKFIGFFRGPVLYGMLQFFTFHALSPISRNVPCFPRALGAPDS